jgi:SAM-dependent methyltransferase
MNRGTFDLLLSPKGQNALAAARELAPVEATFLGCFGKLAKQFDSELARAALETALLRRRAESKFTRAQQMYFTREALEQATSETVARHRAGRFTSMGRTLDLGCGIGGDTLALAAATSVMAIDNDDLRLAMARENVRAYGATADFHKADGLTWEGSIDAVFVDPDRRVGGRRQLSIESCEPLLSAVRERFAGKPIAAKLAPGVPRNEIHALGGEAEFVSLDGELKECVWWHGPWATTRVRATVLPSGDSIASDDPTPLPAPDAPGKWLIDPGPAIVRAGLVGNLAERLDAWPLEPGIAYLTAEDFAPTPFARGWPIVAAMPFHKQILRDYFRAASIGRVNGMRRGVPIDPEELVRKMKLAGDRGAHLILCPHEGKPWAFVCAAP